jgi:hypothetical protein
LYSAAVFHLTFAHVCKLLHKAVLANHKGIEAMAEKKADGNQTPAHLSLASRILGAGLRGKSAESQLDEPWRNKTAKRKSKGKRRK